MTITSIGPESNPGLGCQSHLPRSGSQFSSCAHLILSCFSFLLVPHVCYRNLSPPSAFSQFIGFALSAQRWSLSCCLCSFLLCHCLPWACAFPDPAHPVHSLVWLSSASCCGSSGFLTSLPSALQCWAWPHGTVYIFQPSLRSCLVRRLSLWCPFVTQGKYFTLRCSWESLQWLPAKGQQQSKDPVRLERALAWNPSHL